MVLPDVNVLIYAFRIESPFYSRCSAWLRQTIESDAPFGVSPLALNALVRITTNHRLFPQPSTHDEAFGFCQDLIDQPNCQVVEPGRRHWDIFRRVCRDSNTIGPKVTDAWCAALAIEHGCEWITFDRDFARFVGLRWRAP
jgi:toxin-antitoxin system PIN domain toxin